MVNRLVSVGDDFKLPPAVKAEDANLPTRLGAASLNATYVPKWKPNTAYLAGDPVVTPAGDTVTAKVNFTSAAGFSAANWNYSTAYAGAASVAGKVDKLTELHVFIAAGQSNMSGRGLPYQGSFDPNDYRIFEYGAKVRTFRQASVPLDMLDTPTGISVATTFAREYLRNQAPGVGVLLIPAAVGASGLLLDTPPGGWATNYAGAYPKLYNLMLTQTTEALAAATAATGLTPVMKGFLWMQGEAEAGGSQSFTKALYSAAFDSIIDGVRTARGANLPVVVGGMVPDYVESGQNGLAIRQALVDTIARKTYTGYAEGIRGGGGSSSVTDLVHYHRAGVEGLGRSFYAAYLRALNNATASIPVPPAGIRASFIGGALTVRWDQPLCRVTDYKVEYSIDGGAWVTLAARTVPADYWAIVTGLTGTAIRVRVSTVNGAATSAPCASIIAGTQPTVSSAPMPPEPSLLTNGGYSAGSLTLNWETSPNAYAYEIWRQDTVGTGPTWNAPSKVTTRFLPTTTITVTGLVATKGYRHWLVITNGSGINYTTNIVEIVA